MVKWTPASQRSAWPRVTVCCHSLTVPLVWLVESKMAKTILIKDIFSSFTQINRISFSSISQRKALSWLLAVCDKSTQNRYVNDTQRGVSRIPKFQNQQIQNKAALPLTIFTCDFRTLVYFRLVLVNKSTQKTRSTKSIISKWQCSGSWANKNGTTMRPKHSFFKGSTFMFLREKFCFHKPYSFIYVICLNPVFLLLLLSSLSLSQPHPHSITLYLSP